MKSEKGITLIKLVIACIAVIMVGFVLVILMKLGVIKFGKNKSNNLDIKVGTKEEKIERNPQHTDKMTFITSNKDEYVFIDDSGNVIKLPRTIMANNSIDEGTIFYNDNILIKKDNKYKVIDFNGNTVFESNDMIRIIMNKEERTLYSFVENGKYGVIDSKGRIIINARYDSDFENIDGIEYFYTYSRNFDPKGEKYLITIFNEDGQMVYETDSWTNSLTESQACETENNINIIEMPRQKNTVDIVNINSAEVLESIKKEDETVVKVRPESNVLFLDWYEGLDNENKKIKEQAIYYWFGEDKKVSRKVEFEETSKDSYVDGVKYYSMIKEGSKKTITDVYGNDIYETNNPIQMIEYQPRENGTVYPFLLEETGNNTYKIINSKGNAVLYEKLDKVGNKYLLVGNTLYTHDGVKYMENVNKYFTLYDLDIIITREKMYIENANGKVAEKNTEGSIELGGYLIDENTVVCQNEGNLLMVDVNDMTINRLDLSSYYNIVVHDGYISASNKSLTNYYNKYGELIYVINK